MSEELKPVTDYRSGIMPMQIQADLECVQMPTCEARKPGDAATKKPASLRAFVHYQRR
jgi:hypothetical protein